LWDGSSFWNANVHGGKFVVRQFSQGAGLATLFFVREIRIFLTFFFATWITGWFEGRSIAEYGLPWRLMFGGRFWVGALLGFVALHGVANSGKTYPGQLMSSRPSGPAWLSGGNVGPEGSVLCTLLMVLCWILCSIWLPYVKYPKPALAENKGEDDCC
jgi:hypothetical protein